MRKIKYGSLCIVVLITSLLLTSFAEAATVVTKSAPYAYGEMYTERGGWLDSCKRIDRAEINNDTGYIYVDMWAKSILWQSHYTLADFCMGNSHPEQSVYISASSYLTVTANFFFKGAMCSNLDTAVARLMVQIIISNEAGWNETFTVADYVVQKIFTMLQFNNEMTYVANTTIPTGSHYYFARVRVYTRCDSGASSTAGAWIDFGSADRFIRLSWIKYEFNSPPNTPSTPSGPTSGYRNVWYTYSTTATDPGDNIRYEFEFSGPMPTVSFTTGWYASGQTGNITVMWETTDPPGTYYIRVRAQDVYGAWSGWSASLQVSIRDPMLTISASSGGANPPTNPSPGTYTYSYGTSVSVTAYPDTANYYYLGYWYLDGSYAGSSNPISVTMASDHSLTAYFFQGGGGGGCPYVATWNGSGFVLDNNLLPSSEYSGRADVTDYYMLQQKLAQREDGTYSLLLSEFEHEHDYIDQAQLLAVDHPADVNVAVTPTGEILTYKNPAPPISATSNDGTDVLPLLNAPDGKYYQGYNGSYLTLTFAAADVSAGAKLVIRAEDFPVMKCPIYVQVFNATGQWNTVAAFHTRSSWATDIINMKGCLPDAQGNFKVRLCFVSKDEIDYVGLDTTPQANIQVHEAKLLNALSSSQGDVTRLLKADDEKYAELLPSQQIRLTFQLPTNQNSQRTFIFYAEGHYETIP